MPTIVKTKSHRVQDQPYQEGDRVVTCFFENRPREHCTVTRCYPVRNCESGWLVDTVADNGFVFKGRDANWFESYENSGNCTSEKR